VVGAGFATPALIGGTVLFAAMVALLYRATMRRVVAQGV
jgi:hypothetical protein